MCAGGAIDWRSKQQSVVAQSSKASEFVALSFCVRDVLWLRKFKREFARILNLATVDRIFDVPIGEDNQACLADVRNEGLWDLLKHVDLKYQLIVDYVRKGELWVENVSSEEMAADILTKNLSTQQFETLRELLGMG